MYDNKVSEKVIWEGAISPEDETPIIASQIQNQPQMMFCYKCNNVIPGNSKYCPCCQIKLYTECPKCGAIYSTQYSFCNQCGTDRKKYLQWQRKRKEAIERENRRQSEILERKRLEEERQRKEEENKRQEEVKKRRRYIKEKYFYILLPLTVVGFILHKLTFIRNFYFHICTFLALSSGIIAFKMGEISILGIIVVVYVCYFIIVVISKIAIFCFEKFNLLKITFNWLEKRYINKFNAE